eukprot:GFKZ01014543.1.p2 GENE.GFKZ01014543.1~~GFKZ01014543.1.p2  ORF type:complete len:157 (+),score=16.97 GFKZ01014543.1:181-651(+)
MSTTTTTRPTTSTRPTISSLHVIYNADGTLAGEVIYHIKKLLGIGHCAACDITHGPHAEKPEFSALKKTMPVAVYNIHRDEMDDGMRQAADGELPCVVARLVGGGDDVRVMGRGELEECEGKVGWFERRIRECVEGMGLDMGQLGGACSIWEKEGL